MANMLVVTTVKLCDPVPLFILMIADYRLLHDWFCQKNEEYDSLGLSVYCVRT